VLIGYMMAAQQVTAQRDVNTKLCAVAHVRKLAQEGTCSFLRIREFLRKYGRRQYPASDASDTCCAVLEYGIRYHHIK
jgi:hypothetical protein